MTKIHHLAGAIWGTLIVLNELRLHKYSWLLIGLAACTAMFWKDAYGKFPKAKGI